MSLTEQWSGICKSVITASFLQLLLSPSFYLPLSHVFWTWLPRNYGWRVSFLVEDRELGAWHLFIHSSPKVRGPCTQNLKIKNKSSSLPSSNDSSSVILLFLSSKCAGVRQMSQPLPPSLGSISSYGIGTVTEPLLSFSLMLPTFHDETVPRNKKGNLWVRIKSEMCYFLICPYHTFPFKMKGSLPYVK